MITAVIIIIHETSIDELEPSLYVYAVDVYAVDVYAVDVCAVDVYVVVVGVYVAVYIIMMTGCDEIQMI